MDSILTQIQDRRSDSRVCRLVIFITDFQICSSDSAQATLDKIEQIYRFVDSHGHIVTFTFLPYVPALSKDPKCKVNTVPTPDHTNYLVMINNRIQALATGNPIGQAFSNKTVGYNHCKNNYKPSSWRDYNTTAPEALRFSCCFTYTDRELITRSTHFFNHVEKFIDSLR